MRLEQIEARLHNLTDGAKPKDRVSFRITFVDGSFVDVRRIGVVWRLEAPVGPSMFTSADGKYVHVTVYHGNKDMATIMVCNKVVQEYSPRGWILVRPEDVSTIERIDAGAVE